MKRSQKASSSLFLLENKRELTPETPKSLIESLKGLVVKGEEIYGEAPTKHCFLRFE
jgi:hypothetical protein